MKKKIQKPFDAEAAKRGATVETKGGDPVRIICYDRLESKYPIVALVNCKSSESCYTYTIGGSLYCDEPSENDLVIVGEVEYPKFKEGDWIFAKNNGKRTWLVIAVNFDYYEVQDTQGLITSIAQTTIDNYYRLWDLRDAKPGDVLVDTLNFLPFIYEGLTIIEYPGAYCGLTTKGDFKIHTSVGCWTDDRVRPATKKERDTLFKKMEEAGYKWDAESLKLSKIQKRWRDNEKADVNGYYIHSDSRVVNHSGYNTYINYNVFSAEKQAKSALAMARISQIMANDERFGGVVTDDEWDSTVLYFVITKVHNMLIITRSHRYEYLGFHTMEQANLFLEENEDLVKDYYMLD